MWPGSQQDESPSTSRSGQSSRLSSASRSRSSSRSSQSRSSVSSRASSRSRPRPRRRSRSRSRRRHQRKYRRYSRSYSRSRSRSRGRRYRDRRYGAPGRSRRSPSRPRSRSRSRSRGRSYYRRAYALAPGRRYYGFGRTLYPEDRRSRRGWSRSRSRSRSRSPTPFRLSEKDRMELLEIAKANAAKALGTANFDLPASLRTVLAPKETNRRTAVPNNGAKSELSEKLTEDGTKNLNEKYCQQKSIAFSSNNSVAKPMLQKSAKATEETSTGSPKINEKKSPYGLWVPV